MLGAALAAVLAGALLGALTLTAERHYSGLERSGATLNGMARLLALGPSAATAWPGWLAAVCFGLAVRRLGSGPPEPPVGDDGRSTVAQLRAALRTELRLVRGAHVAVAGLCLVDAGRLLWFCLAGVVDGLARRGLPALAVEVAGLVVATLVLRAWLRRFARQLELLGAL